MKEKLRRVLLAVLCMLICIAVLGAAQAEEGTGPVIYLNGEPVTEAVLNMSESDQLQFTSNEEVTWKSSKSYRGSIDQTGLLTAKSASTITISATNAKGQKATCEVRMARLVTSLTITGSTEVAGGKRVNLKASVSPSNASNKKVTWSSSDTSVATVNTSGRVTAKKIEEEKSVVITATAADGSGVVAAHTITVKPSAESVSIVSGENAVKEVFIDITSNPTVQLGAKVFPAGASQNVTWKTSSSRTVSVTSEGLLTGLKTGSATITATAADGTGKKTTVKVRVVRMATGIKITGTTSVLAGKRVTLSASVEPSNATEKKVTWSSSDPSVATVDSRGRVTAQKVTGLKSVVITATAKDGSGVAAQHTINVTPAISKMQVTADESVVSGTLVIDLTTSPTVDLGMYIEPADACQDVKWTSSSTRRATVDENGVVSAKQTGTVKITATAQDGSNKKATVTISIIRAVKSITVTGDTALAAGKKGKLSASVEPSNATNKGVTWESSNTAVLTVDSRGRITAKQSDAVQQVTVYAKAKDGSGVVGSTVVTVTPRATSVTILKDGAKAEKIGIDLSGERQVQLSAVVGPEAAHQGVKWSTSNKRRATVDENGVVTGVSDGSATITATATDGTGVKAKIEVTVGTTVKQVIITGPATIASGDTVRLTASVQPSNATEKDVIWSSADPELLSVDKKGRVTAYPVEEQTQVMIYATAADGAGAVGEYLVTIPPVATSISIQRLDAPMTTATIVMDEDRAKLRLGATIEPALASQKVRWSTSRSSVAQVDENGVVTTRGSGQVTITATATDGSGVSASVRLAVGETNSMPYYLEIDYANQVVRVYERGADHSYTNLVKRMICSTRLVDDERDYGLFTINSNRMVWMLSEANTYAMYATRLWGTILFHSVVYPTKDMGNLNAVEYEKLGQPASLGCIRLLTADAKWIHDNVPQGCYVRAMRGVRDINEYGSVSAPPLTGSGWDPTNPDPRNPDYDPTYTSDVK